MLSSHYFFFLFFIIAFSFSDNSFAEKDIQYEFHKIAPQTSGLDHKQLDGKRYNDNGKVNRDFYKRDEFYTGGAAVGDFFNNGYPDLYFTRIDDTDILYKNKGNGKFVDKTQEVFGDHMVNAPTNGALFADLTNNGYLDLYVTSFGGKRNYLFINNGENQLKEKAKQHNATLPPPGKLTDLPEGLVPLDKTAGQSVTAGDYNRDGYLDLYISNYHDRTVGGFALDYFQNRSPTLRRKLRKITEGKPLYTLITNEDLLKKAENSKNIDNKIKEKLNHFHKVLEEQDLIDKIPKPRNKLLLNKGNKAPGHFINVTEQAGLDTIMNRSGFSGRFADMNKDGYPELLAANDFRNVEFFKNNTDGTFTEVSDKYGVGTSKNAMGHAVADYNNDGWLDWFVTSVKQRTGNRLFRNEIHLALNDIYFSDVTDLAGVRKGGWGWGASFIDFNNDGLRDLMMVNGGRREPHRNYPAKFWKNLGPEKNFEFEEIASEIGLYDTGQGRGLIVADFYNNGCQDVLIVKWANQPALYRNQCQGKNNWLRIKTIGNKSNKMGIGAFIKIIPDIQKKSDFFVDDIDLGANYVSHNQAVAHFGLEQTDKVDLIRIKWPSGKSQRLENIKANQLLVVHEKKGTIQKTALD